MQTLIIEMPSHNILMAKIYNSLTLVVKYFKNKVIKKLTVNNTTSYKIGQNGRTICQTEQCIKNSNIKCSIKVHFLF